MFGANYFGQPYFGQVYPIYAEVGPVTYEDTGTISGVLSASGEDIYSASTMGIGLAYDRTGRQYQFERRIRLVTHEDTGMVRGRLSVSGMDDYRIEPNGQAEEEEVLFAFAMMLLDD